MPKKIFTEELEGTRRGKPRKRWKEELERDLQVLGVRRWRELVADRKKWKDIVRQWAVVPMKEEDNLGDQMKAQKMSRVGRRGGLRVLVEKPELEGPLGRPSCRWEDDKIVL